jgi:hypothetical protein
MMMHYTNKDGYNGVKSPVAWRFEARQPPGDRPFGAYFTTLRPDANRFSARTRIPKEKQAYVFAFNGQEGLQPFEGGRGEYIFLSPVDYLVDQPRHVYDGISENLP